MDAAYSALKDEIVRGRLGAGTPIVEVDTASRLGVSRTPIREALRRLEQDGLVVSTGRGMVVRSHSPEEILEVYEARIVLETAVARAAALRRTDADLLRLGALLRRAQKLSASKAAVLAAANQELHRAVWIAGHNGALVDLLERLIVHIARYPATTLSRPGRWEQALEEHAALIDAIRERDAERAAQLAEQHFTAARELRIAMWEDELGGGSGA